MVGKTRVVGKKQHLKGRCHDCHSHSMSKDEQAKLSAEDAVTIDAPLVQRVLPTRSSLQNTVIIGTLLFIFLNNSEFLFLWRTTFQKSYKQ